MKEYVMENEKNFMFAVVMSRYGGIFVCGMEASYTKTFEEDVIKSGYVLISGIHSQEIYHIKERQEYLKDNFDFMTGVPGAQEVKWELECAHSTYIDCKPKWCKENKYRRKPKANVYWTCLVKEKFGMEHPLPMTFHQTDDNENIKTMVDWRDRLECKGYIIVGEIHEDKILIE